MPTTKLSPALKRAVLHQHRGHRSAAAIEFGFEHHAGRGAFRSRLQLRRSATRQIISISRLRFVFFFAETSTNTVLPPQSSGHQAAIGELLLHAIGHGVGLVDLVDRDDDRNFGGVRVIDGFERLRHHAVIGSHDQHDDVGGLGAARTHAGEGFVTRRIEEHDLAPEGGDSLSVMRTL